MKHFRVSIETTKIGTLLVRSEDVDGTRETWHEIKKFSDAMMVDGKGPFKGRDLAEALRLQVLHRHQMKTQGGIDLRQPIRPLVEAFYRERKSKNISYGTQENCRVAIDSFLTQEKIITLEDLSRKKILEWREMLNTQYKVSTIRLRMTYMGVFINWLLFNEHLNGHPFGKGILPAKEASDEKFYTTPEFEALDKAFVAMDEPAARLAVNFMYSAGLRKGEMVGDVEGTHHGACWQDIVWNGVKGVELSIPPNITKTKKGRVVDLDDGLLALLGSRKLGPLAPVDRRRFDYLFCLARKLSGINPRLTPHGLRHTFAKDWLQKSGGTLSELSALLGHSSLVTTQIYARFERGHTRQGIDRVYEQRMLEKKLMDKNIDENPDGRMTGDLAK